MGLKQSQGARRGWLVKLMLRTLSKTAKRDRLHILFLVDDYSYLRNFDDSIRRLLRSSHKVTIAYPESRAGSIAKTRERRMFRNGDCSIAFVPRCNFNSLGNAVRRARNYLLYRRPAFSKARFLKNRVSSQTPQAIKQLLDRPVIRSWPNVADLTCKIIEWLIPPSTMATKILQDIKPDVVLLTPYVTSEALYQIEYAKAGQRLGIPIGVPVFSWDNLSTKGRYT